MERPKQRHSLFNSDHSDLLPIFFRVRLWYRPVYNEQGFGDELEQINSSLVLACSYDVFYFSTQCSCAVFDVNECELNSVCGRCCVCVHRQKFLEE